MFTENLVKAYVILANAVTPLDGDVGFDVTNSLVSAINKLSIDNVQLGQSKLNPALSSYAFSYVKSRGSLSADDILDLTEMIGPFFEQLAKGDCENAENTASRLDHSGLRALAKLGISRALSQEPQKPKAMPQIQQRAAKS